MSGGKDHFNSFTRPIEKKLVNIGGTLQKWTTAMKVETTGDGHNSDFEAQNNKLKSLVRQCREDINDLERNTIINVEENPGDYRNITPKDLDTYKAYVKQTRDKLKQVQKKCQQGDAVINRRARNSLLGGAAVKVDRSNYTNRQLYDERRDLVTQQDDMMDQIEDKIGELKVKADDIYTTVEKQNEVLDKLQGDMDSAQNRFEAVNAKLKKFLGTSDSCQTSQVFVLVLLLVGGVLLNSFAA